MHSLDIAAPPKKRVVPDSHRRIARIPRAPPAVAATLDNAVIGYVQSGCYDMKKITKDEFAPIVSHLQTYEELRRGGTPRISRPANTKWNHLHIDELVVSQRYSKRHNPIKNKDMYTGRWLLYKWAAEFSPTARSIWMTTVEYTQFTRRERTTEDDIRHQLTRINDRFDTDTEKWEVGPRISLHVDLSKLQLVKWYETMGFVRCDDADATNLCPNPNPLPTDVGNVYEMRIAAPQFFQYLHAFYQEHYVNKFRTSPVFREGYTNRRAVWTSAEMSLQYCRAFPMLRRRNIEQEVSETELFDESYLLCPNTTVIAGMVELIMVEYETKFRFYMARNTPGGAKLENAEVLNVASAFKRSDVEVYAFQRLLSFKYKRAEMNPTKWTLKQTNVQKTGVIVRDDPDQNNLCYVAWLIPTTL